jgi:catechol 2,3-dioxygenase-like lactoylglutathione lyase family enzyme
MRTMRVERITTNLPVEDIAEAKSFYTDFLGLAVEEFDLGWVARFTSPETGAHVQLVTRDGRPSRSRDRASAHHGGVGSPTIPRARS